MIPMKEQKEKNEERGDGKLDVRVVFWRWRRIFSRDVELLPWKLRPPSRNPNVAGVMRYGRI
jgi:hypothetical protein